MYAVVIGVLLVLAKVAEFGPFAAWSWWIILAPFAVAVAWWQFSDSTGITKRREIERIDQRKQERREKALEALGIDSSRDRQVRKARESAARRNELMSGRNDAKAEQEGQRNPRP